MLYFDNNPAMSAQEGEGMKEGKKIYFSNSLSKIVLPTDTA